MYREHENREYKVLGSSPYPLSEYQRVTDKGRPNVFDYILTVQASKSFNNKAPIRCPLLRLFLLAN